MNPKHNLSAIGTFSRRRFVGLSAGVATGCSLGLPAWAIDCAETHPGNALRLPPNWTNGDDLIVAPDSLEIFPGRQTSVFSINGSVPGPTIRLTRRLDATYLPIESFRHTHLNPDGEPRPYIYALYKKTGDESGEGDLPGDAL